jgi:hypothetical protein
MTTRKAAASLLYSTGPSINWARALRSFIDEGMAALCVRQRQRAPIVIAQLPDLTARLLSRGRMIRGARVTFRNQEMQT